MENDLDDLIADYISGALSPESRQQFEQRLAADPALARKLALEQELHTALGSSTPEAAFRENLRRLAEKFDHPEKLSPDPKGTRRNKTWFWWILGAGFIILSGILLWRSSRKPSSEPVQESQKTPVNPGQQQRTPDATIPEIQDVHPDHTPVKSAPMASAFEELPALETYIGSQLRGEDYHFIITAPLRNNPLRSNQGKTVFYLKGKLEGKMPADASFKVLIFSNSRRRFEAMQPLTAYSLGFDDDAQFNLGAILPLSPGLYYYLIEEQESGSWVYVDKFSVK